MKQSVPGSALLIMLIITAGLLVYCTIVYRTTTLYTDVAEQKRAFEQQKWYAHGILNWGIAVAKTHFAHIIQERAAGDLQIGLQLSTDVPHDQTGSLILSAADENTVKLSAHASRGQAVCTISCQLNQRSLEGQKPEYSITSWKIGE